MCHACFIDERAILGSLYQAALPIKCSTSHVQRSCLFMMLLMPWLGTLRSLETF